MASEKLDVFLLISGLHVKEREREREREREERFCRKRTLPALAAGCLSPSEENKSSPGSLHQSQCQWLGSVHSKGQKLLVFMK